MSRRSVLWVAAVLITIALVFILQQRAAPPRAFVGGPILTLDAANTIAAGLATDGDRIVRVGDEASIRAWAQDRGAEVVELNGRAIVPGFIDAHGHFPGEGLAAVHADLNSPPIGEVQRIDDLVAALAKRAEGRDEGEWVVGVGYDDTLVEEKRHPTRVDLDRVSSKHPVAAIHVSGHLAAVNSEGLARLGFDRDTEDPEGGRIQRESGSGEPNGVLEENAMMGIQALLQPSAMEGLDITRLATERYLAAGVTTAQSGHTNRALIVGLSWMSRIGIVPLRLVIWPDAETTDALLDAGESLESHDPLYVNIGAVKLVADGSIQGYTGYLSEPYYVPPGDDASYRGYARIPRDELIERVTRYHAAGLQIAVHGNGDASIDDILDAYEAAQRAHPRQDARHIIIHAQMARDDQLDRMAALGVIPSFFSLHTYYWGDRHRDVFMGPERASRMSPARSASDRGIRFTIHADSPIVPMEPLRLVWAAVNRRSTSGAAIGERERIDVFQALRAVTIDAAYQHFEDLEKGSLEPGKLADLVVLSGSPLDDPAAIDRLTVEETIVGGRTLYRAGSE